MTIVPGGNQWGLLLASRLGLPLTIIRDGPSDMSKEVEALQKNQLYERTLYFRRNMAGEAVVVVDDVISTGSTAGFVIENLRRAKADVLAVVALILKGPAHRKLSADYGVPVHGILRVDEEDGVSFPEQSS